MPNILITYATRPVSQRIIRRLEESGFDVFQATCEEVPSILQHKFLKIPHAQNPVYVHEVLKICIEHQVNYLLPISRLEVENLLKANVLFEEYETKIIAPQKDFEQHILSSVPHDAELDILVDGQSLLHPTASCPEVSGIIIRTNGDTAQVLI